MVYTVFVALTRFIGLSERICGTDELLYGMADNNRGTEGNLTGRDVAF